MFTCHIKIMHPPHCKAPIQRYKHYKTHEYQESNCLIYYVVMIWDLLGQIKGR